jgi:hydroxymethylpyrimidine/phosphomethylpyrimidine kinase
MTGTTAARDLLQLGVKSVLIKGGHTLTESIANGSGSRISAIDDSLGYAQDYFLSSAPPRKEGEQRLCDGCRGVWIRSQR